MKAGIERRVLDNHDIVLVDRVGAEADVAAGFIVVDTIVGGQKDMIVADHVYRGGRAVENAYRHIDDRIEARQARLFVDTIFGERLKPSRLVA